MFIKKAAAILALALGLSSVSAYAKTMEFTIGSADMYVDDTSVSHTVLDCKPYTSNDRTMVPVRVISENFGADVKWDDAERRVDISSGDTNITLHIGSYEASVNGEAKTLDVAPELKDSRTMVPLRFISEALGKRVEYVESSEQIIISDEDYAITVDGFNLSIDDIKIFLLYQGISADEETLKADFESLKAEIIKILAVSEYEKNSGTELTKEDLDIVDKTFTDVKDMVYSADCLVAPGIKLYSELLYSEKFTENIQLPENDELKKLYEEEFIKVKHILIKSFDTNTAMYFDEERMADAKKRCEDILKKIKKGEKFETLYDEYNEDVEAFFYPDGMLISKYGIIEDFANAAFSLDENEVSEIVETYNGFHIIKRYPLPEFSDEVIKEISSDVKNLQAEILANDIANNAKVDQHMTDDEIISKILN